MAHMHVANSKLCLNYCLLSFPKVIPMTWLQSRDKGEMPERGKQSPSGVPRVTISLHWMGTSQGRFCLDGK